MSSFIQGILDWRTFFGVLTQASATFIGLLFVAISINISFIRKKAYLDLQYFAALTFNSFFSVFLISILFLVPNLSPLGLGIPLLILGGVGFGNAIWQDIRAGQVHAKHKGTGVANRFIIPILCQFCLVVIAILLMLQISQAMYALIIIILLLLASATVNAWTLLINFGEETTEVPSSKLPPKDRLGK